MPIIKLTDYDPPFPKSLRSFFFNLSDYIVQEKSESEVSQSTFGVSGYGAFYRTKLLPVNKKFLALYVYEKAIWIYANQRNFKVSGDVTAKLITDFPFKKFSIYQAGQEIFQEKYIGSLLARIDEYETDLFEFIEETLKSKSKRKLFAYLRSASSVGIERTIPSSGFTESFIMSIKDPYDF